MRFPRLAAPVAAGLAAAVAAFAVVVLTTERGGDPPPRRSAGGAYPEGEAVFARMGCGSCHRLAAASSRGRIGPDLDTRLQDHTRQSLTAQILSPARRGMGMPTDFGERMNTRELAALVDFLLSARRDP